MKLKLNKQIYQTLNSLNFNKSYNNVYVNKLAKIINQNINNTDMFFNGTIKFVKILIKLKLCLNLLLNLS